MSLRVQNKLRIAAIAVIIVGSISLLKYVFIEFSLSESEGENILIRVCLFLLFPSVSISGVVALWSFMVAWIALLGSQVFGILILISTNTFGRGPLTLNTFMFQHFFVVVLAFIILVLVDIRSRAATK